MASVVISGDTSGSVTLSAPAVAGTTTLTLPSTSGTVLTTASTTGISGSAISTGTVAEAYGGTGTNTGYYGFKNRIINGAMVIDQRNAGASQTPNGTFVVDRWIYQNSQASKFTAQQNQNSVTPPTGFTYYSGLTSSSAYTLLAGDYFLYRQFIEGFNVADLAWGTASATTVTLSFWVRSSLTGTFGGALNNSGQSRSYPFTYTISSANTWEQKSITVAGDTSGTWLTTNGIGLIVGFSLGTGSTSSGTAGAWAGSALFSATGATSVVGTNGATFYITGVQLEKGSTATSFDYRPYGTELALCQRYFEMTYSQGTAPATNTGTGTIAFTVGSDGGNNANITYYYKTTKRTAPTITFYTQSGTSGSWDYSRSGASGTMTMNVNLPSDSVVTCYGSIGAAWVVGFVKGHITASAEL